VTCEEAAITLTSGEAGVQMLVLQYPRRQAGG
jgi:hypothetical protein